eukprot:1826666-Prymnesium_polylepis.2
MGCINFVGQAVVAELEDKLNERAVVFCVKIIIEAARCCERDAQDRCEEAEREAGCDKTLLHRQHPLPLTVALVDLRLLRGPIVQDLRAWARLRAHTKRVDVVLVRLWLSCDREAV